MAAFDTLEDAANIYGLDLEAFIQEIAREAAPFPLEPQNVEEK
jgi:hypothetical protein